ncbi:translocation/assembly module TamB domain-containing protein [Nannocystis sp.]|uniref:translocation/assembly module TamB domain-containing protein n=1 Tax=Nannocystis sp. TaxID=1962667 RepID=UPI0025DBD7C0|nr:translocation/assembly module TamB domain-containing protein [Nannocystis sp.]MBK7824353.1 translocation/assembly module TamB domain-containing protein [Nannocystis sp.]
MATADESGRSGHSSSFGGGLTDWQFEADLLADGRVLLERLCDRIRTRHLYPAGPNLALLLEAYQILHRERLVGRASDRPRSLRRRLRQLLRQLVRSDVALRSLRLTYRFPTARPQPLHTAIPAIVDRALLAVDADAIAPVRAHIQGATPGPKRSDTSAPDLSGRFDARLYRGLSQLRDALINEALAHPREIPGLHDQYLHFCRAGLPTRVQHPIARLLLVKLPIYLWLGFIGLFAVIYVGAYFFLNDENLGRLLTRVIGNQINGDLELGSVHWSPRLILDLVTGTPHHAVVRDVKIWRGYKRQGGERDKLTGWADHVEANIVLHEIIPWNRLGVPPVFEIPWTLHFTEAEIIEPLHIDVHEFAMRDKDDRLTWGISLLDAFSPNPSAPTAPAETRGISFRLDKVQLHDTDLDLDFRPQSGWQTALHLTEGRFSLYFEGLHPKQPKPEKKPLIFDVEASADTGLLRILALNYELPIADLELSQFAAGGAVPLGDVRIRGAGSFAGSPAVIDGWLRDAFSTGARNVDMTILFGEAGPLARTIGEAHKLPATMISADDASAQLTLKGPLQDVTIGLAASGLGLDFFTDPDAPEPSPLDWSLRRADVRLSMNKEPVPAMWGERYHRSGRERWVVDFAHLEGDALGGHLRMREHSGRNHLVIGEPGEPLVVALESEFRDLDPGLLFAPGDTRARLSGKADGTLGLRELVLRLGGAAEEDVKPAAEADPEDIRESSTPEPAPTVLATQDRDLSPAPEATQTGLRRVVLDLADVELQRARGPADDSLPRRIGARGTVVLDEETGLDLSDLEIDVDGGSLKIDGGLGKQLDTFKPTDLRLRISDGATFLKGFGQGPYFERLSAGLTLSGKLERPDGSNGSLTLSDVGSGKFALTDISEVKLAMDRGVLSLRSGKVGLLGGTGKLAADLDLFADDPGIYADLDLKAVDLAKLGNESVGGRGDVALKIGEHTRRIPLSRAHADGALFVPHLRLGGGEFRDVVASFAVDRKQLTVKDIVLHHHRSISPSFAPEVTVPVGDLHASGSVSFASDPELDLDVAVTGLPISAFAAIAGLGDLPAGAQIAGGKIRDPAQIQRGGKLKLEAGEIERGTHLDVTGTLARPSIQGLIELRAIHAAGVPLGTGLLKLKSEDLEAGDGLVARRKIEVTGSFGDSGKKHSPDYEWGLAATVAFGPKPRKGAAPMSADLRLDFANLPLVNILHAVGLKAEGLHGELRGLNLRAQSCAPGVPLISACLWDQRPSAIRILVDLERLWAATREPTGGAKPGDGVPGDPCLDKASLCSEDRLIGVLGGTRLGLNQPWSLRTGGRNGGVSLALSGDIELASPQGPASAAPKDAAAAMSLDVAVAPKRKRCDKPPDTARTPAPGSGHAVVQGELLLGALAPLVRSYGLSDLAGRIKIKVEIDGHIADPILTGDFSVPAGAPPLTVSAADKSWSLAVPRLALGWRQDTLFADDGELQIRDQTLQFGPVGAHRTYYVLGGECQGNFSAAAAGLLNARPLRDLLPGTFATSSGGLDVQVAHVAGLVDDPLQIHAMRGSFIPGNEGLRVELAGVGLDPIDLREGSIDVLRCSDDTPCPHGQDGYALYLGGVPRVADAANQAQKTLAVQKPTSERPPAAALRAHVGDRGRVAAWGHAVLSPDFTRITSTDLRVELDEIAYRMFDNSGRPQLYATIASDSITLEGRDSMTLRGEVLVNRGRWVRDAQEGVKVLSFADPTTTPASPPPEIVRDMALDLRIRTTAPFRVDNNVMKGVEGQVLLAIGGTLGDLEMSGKIDVSTGVLDVAILNGAYDVQYGKVQLERTLEASTVDVLALRQEPIYVENQPRQMYVKLGGTLDAITWRCIVQGDTRTRGRTTRECVDYLVLGAGNKEVADSNVRRYGGGGLLGRPIGLVGNLTELKLGKYVEQNAPRLAPYLPDISMRLGQLGIEASAETPRPWFRSDWGNLSVGAGYTRGYPGLLLRNSYDWRVRFRILDTATLEFRDNRRSYFNERIIFDPLRQRSLELRLDYTLPSMR